MLTIQTWDYIKDVVEASSRLDRLAMGSFMISELKVNSKENPRKP